MMDEFFRFGTAIAVSCGIVTLALSIFGFLKERSFLVARYKNMAIALQNIQEIRADVSGRSLAKDRYDFERLLTNAVTALSKFTTIPVAATVYLVSFEGHAARLVPYVRDEKSARIRPVMSQGLRYEESPLFRYVVESDGRMIIFNEHVNESGDPLGARPKIRSRSHVGSLLVFPLRRGSMVPYGFVTFDCSTRNVFSKETVELARKFSDLTKDLLEATLTARHVPNDELNFNLSQGRGS